MPVTAEGSLQDDTESYAEEAYEVKVFFWRQMVIFVLVMVILGQRVIYTVFLLEGVFLGGKNLFAN